MPTFAQQGPRADGVRVESLSKGNSTCVIFVKPSEVYAQSLPKVNTRASPATARKRRLHKNDLTAIKMQQKLKEAGEAMDKVLASTPKPAEKTGTRVRRNPRPATSNGPADDGRSAFDGFDMNVFKTKHFSLSPVKVRRAGGAGQMNAIVLLILRKLDRLLSTKRLRIIDFFRGRKYNNSMENIGMRVDDDDGDNLLNPEEFANILRETDSTFKMSEIKFLVQYLDRDGNREIDAMELTKALQVARIDERTDAQVEAEIAMHREQGTVEAAFKEQRAKQAKDNNFAANLDLKNMEDVTDLALLEIDRFLKLRSMRLIDLFRYREFNISAQKAGKGKMGDMGGSGDMMLSPEELTHILTKAGVMLTKRQILEIVVQIDHDQNGEVDVKELEMAVKNARKRHRGTTQDAVSRLKQLPPGTLLSKISATPNRTRSSVNVRKIIPKIIQQRYNPTYSLARQAQLPPSIAP